MAKGEPTARFARELGMSRKPLLTWRQRVQTNLNNTAPADVMTGTAFAADAKCMATPVRERVTSYFRLFTFVFFKNFLSSFI
jgi:hypothetical protein